MGTPDLPDLVVFSLDCFEIAIVSQIFALGNWRS